MVRAGYLIAALVALALGGTPARADEAADHLKTCAAANDARSCAVSRAEFVKWFPLAYRGDYQGQRNVAFCLRDGCDGAVQLNPGLACAWRQVIILSGSNRVDGTDQANLRLDCGRLDAVGATAAKAQAERLMRTIRSAGR